MCFCCCVEGWVSKLGGVLKGREKELLGNITLRWRVTKGSKFQRGVCYVLVYVHVFVFTSSIK